MEPKDAIKTLQRLQLDAKDLLLKPDEIEALRMSISYLTAYSGGFKAGFIIYTGDGDRCVDSNEEDNWNWQDSRSYLEACRDIFYAAKTNAALNEQTRALAARMINAVDYLLSEKPSVTA